MYCMEILQDRNLGKYLFDRYCINPKNWKFLISPSHQQDGFFDATISNFDEVWQIKFDSIYKPIPIVIGTKVDMDVTKVYKQIESAPFGYRKIESDSILKIMSRIIDYESATAMSVEPSSTNLINLLNSIEPVIPSQKGSYAYGPFAFSNVSPLMKNERQKNVSEKLSRKLRQILKDKYSSYG